MVEYNPYHGNDGKFAGRGAMSQARTYKQAVNAEKEYNNTPPEKKSSTGRKILRTMLGVAVGASIIAGAAYLSGPALFSIVTAKIGGMTFAGIGGATGPLAARAAAGVLATAAYLGITRRPIESEETATTKKTKGVPMKNIPLVVTSLKNAFEKAKTDKERDKIMKLSISLWKEIAQQLPS